MPKSTKRKLQQMAAAAPPGNFRGESAQKTTRRASGAALRCNGQNFACDIGSTVPKGRFVLNVAEVAAAWHVTQTHITNLIEEGQLSAIDVAGNLESHPVPKAALNQLAVRLKVTPEQLWEFIRTFESVGPKKRHLWRVPVESYTAFMEKRHSLNLK